MSHNVTSSKSPDALTPSDGQARAQKSHRVRAAVRRTGRWVMNVLLVLVFFFPFFWMAASSLKTLGETMQFPPSLLPADPQWQNYRSAWTSIPFGKYLVNSCIVTASVLLLQALTVVPSAYAFSQYDFKGKNLLFGGTLITMMVPAQLVFLPLFVLFAKWHLINTYASLILPFATSAFNIFMLRQTFNQMPRELVEAARTLPVGVASMRASESGINFHVLMAANVLLSLPILVIYLFANKHIIKAFSYIGDK